MKSVSLQIKCNINKQNEKTSPFLWIESNRLKATEPL